MNTYKENFMAEPKPIKNDSTIRIYRDGKPVDIPVNEFLHMLEELKNG